MDNKDSQSRGKGMGNRKDPNDFIDDASTTQSPRRKSILAHLGDGQLRSGDISPIEVPINDGEPQHHRPWFLSSLSPSFSERDPFLAQGYSEQHVTTPDPSLFDTGPLENSSKENYLADTKGVYNVAQNGNLSNFQDRQLSPDVRRKVSLGVQSERSEVKEKAPTDSALHTSPSLTISQHDKYNQATGGSDKAHSMLSIPVSDQEERRDVKVDPSVVAYSNPFSYRHIDSHLDVLKESGVEKRTEDGVLPTGPVDRFLVPCDAHPPNTSVIQPPGYVDSARHVQPRNEDEMTLMQFAEYTDDDSFFSNCSSVFTDNAHSRPISPLQGQSIKSVHETIRLHSLSHQQPKKDYEFDRLMETPWLYQIHTKASALLYSSFFIFPPRWRWRVVVYNFLHHWSWEVILFFMILSYAVFQASWTRYSIPKGGHMIRPNYMHVADVFFTILFGMELLLALFAKGLVLHRRAFLRSPWHWLDTAVLVLMILACTNDQRLWNFTAWRLIRCIKCLMRVPRPVYMKILAKSLLRSTKAVITICMFLLYFIFFFSLLGLQLFLGGLHSRCVSNLTGKVTNEICRGASTDSDSIYDGHHCSKHYTCVQDAFPNPHYSFRSFDDLGHAMLTTFQIITFQGWAGALKETSDSRTVGAFLYYLLAILLCTWIIPSLFLGVFLMKIEKHSRLFVIKQLNRFNDILLEQQRRMSGTIRLKDYVMRDKNADLMHYPVYAAQPIDNGAVVSKSCFLRKKRKPKVIRSYWTEERHLQLHLSLARNQAIAKDVEEIGADSEQKNSSRCGVISSAVHNVTRCPDPLPNIHEGEWIDRTKSGMSAALEIEESKEFALGGRVGILQHHSSTTTVGASQRADEPLAIRQKKKSKMVHFLDPYLNYNVCDAAPEEDSNQFQASVTEPTRVSNSQIVSTSISAPWPAPSTPGTNIHVAPEPVGVVPIRHSTTPARSMRSHEGEIDSINGVGKDSFRLEKAQFSKRTRGLLIIQDPEGGCFSRSNTYWDKFSVVQNMLHMFTEGYARVLSEYMWRHRMMTYSYNLLPVRYADLLKENMRWRMRSGQANGYAQEQRGMAYGGELLPTLEEQKYFNNSTIDKTCGVGGHEKTFGGYSRSLLNMAQNIKHNIPATNFGKFIQLLIILNAIFNATRFENMPDYWERNIFFAGVVFSSFFLIELLMRIVALGLGPFFFDAFNLVDFFVVLLSLFQLGFSRTNTISLFNSIRFLKPLRVFPVRTTRHVFQVLLTAIPGMIYALVFFSLYAFMWVLIGMSFFGSRTNWVSPTDADYSTRANFETFSHAVYAVAQTFSLNRDQWLYASWNGMRVRGGYTIFYFIFTVLTAVIFRFYFMALFMWAWQCQENRREFFERNLVAGCKDSFFSTMQNQNCLPWFDFTIWRSFKHIHGGFDRRDVAPDEVYCLSEAMQRELQFAKNRHADRKKSADVDDSVSPTLMIGRHKAQWLPMHSQGGESEKGVHNLRAEDRTYSATILDEWEPNLRREAAYESRGQLRFARDWRFVVAPRILSQRIQAMSNPLDSPCTVHERKLSPSLSPTDPSPVPNIHTHAQPRDVPGTQSVELQSAQPVPPLHKSSTTLHESKEDGNLVRTGDNKPLRHLLLSGPRMQYKTIFQHGRCVFEVCLDCNTHKEMPLRSPPGVAQRTADDLHAEHCHMAALRSSRQLVLNTLLGYVRMQSEHAVRPTRHMLEVVLGQAWDCGMLLSENIDNLTCADRPRTEWKWDELLQALEIQQWLLELHIGEEQVGRATLAYILAQQQRKEPSVLSQASERKESWRDYSFMILTRSSPIRRYAILIVRSAWFKAFILLTIFIASICLAAQTPGLYNRDMGGDYNSGKYTALHVLDDIFTLIFIVEMLLKWVSMGVILPVGRAYFWHLWNIFDCFIVICSLVSWCTDWVFLRYLKALRCFCIIGPLRYWSWNPTMMPVARALWDCVPILANISIAMLMNYVVWAIVFTSMFVNKMNTCSNGAIKSRKECLNQGFAWKPVTRNFGNFYESLLTTFEVSTGGEWLDVIYSAVDSWSTEFPPEVNRHPYKGLVFVVYYYVSHFFFFTFLSSGMIYSYFVAKNHTKEMNPQRHLWHPIEEGIMCIKPKIRMLPMPYPISHLFHRIVCSERFELFMSFIVWSNVLTMALEWYHMAHVQKVTLTVLQSIFVAIFTIEVLMRIIAHGRRFFTRWAYCWDLCVLFLSYLQFILNATHTHRMPFNVNVLRLLRLRRALRLFNLVTLSSTDLVLLGKVLRSAVPSLVNVSLIYILGVYIFAIVGLHYLGSMVPHGSFIDQKYNNFATFVNSVIMVFRLSTLQDWATMLRASLEGNDNCGKFDHRCGPNHFAPIYYIAMMIFFFAMISSLYVAVITDSFISFIRLRMAFTRLGDLYRFCELWSYHDPNARLTLPAAKITKILEYLHPPLGIRNLRTRAELLRVLQVYDIPVRNGCVDYYAVLFALARRVVSESFCDEAKLAKIFGLGWHLTNDPEKIVPEFRYRAADIGFRGYTLAEWYTVSYIQAAYRRDRAMRNYFIAKSELWRIGRRECVRQGIPYHQCAFGRQTLDCEDPREEGRRRGFNVSEDSTTDESSPVFSSTITRRNVHAGMRNGIEGAQMARDGDTTNGAIISLPVTQRSAIMLLEDRFGPNAPNAIRRFERRTEKLRRRQEQEARERLIGKGEPESWNEGFLQWVRGSTPIASRRSAANPLSWEYDSAEPNNVSTHVCGNSLPRASGGEVGKIRIIAISPPLENQNRNIHRSDLSSPSYQPPLGTNPELFENVGTDLPQEVAFTEQIFSGDEHQKST